MNVQYKMVYFFEVSVQKTCSALLPCVVNLNKALLCFFKQYFKGGIVILFEICIWAKSSESLMLDYFFI